MTTARKTSPTPRQSKAVASPHPSKPRFQVVETNLHYITNAGDELVFTLDIPTGVMLDAMKPGQSQAEQFYAMLKAMGDDETLDDFRKLGWVSEGNDVVNTYFDEFANLTGVTPGESESSSD